MRTLGDTTAENAFGVKIGERQVRGSTAFLLIVLGAAAGCQSDSALDGTWFYQTTENGATVYRGEQIIVQDGSRVTLTDCRRNVTDLRRDGSSLLNANGSQYYLHIVDNGTLAGTGDTGTPSIAVKLSPSTRFAHGLLHINSPLTGERTAADDVCAEKRQSRHANDHGERLAQTIYITAPYGQTSVRIEISFRDITEGVHPLLQFDDFVDGSGPGVLVTVESAAFLGHLGNDALPIVSGTVNVSDPRSATFEVSGALQLATGEMLSLSSRVNLDMPLVPR